MAPAYNIILVKFNYKNGCINISILPLAGTNFNEMFMINANRMSYNRVRSSATKWGHLIMFT